MGLISGLIMGAMVGISLIAGWNRMMKRRSAKRAAKAADIKLLASMGRDELKKLCGDSYPEWVSFPAFEQVKWLNKLLGKMWPFIAEAATLVIKDTVEPLLDDYRPSGISSLKFSKLSLGNVPPKIEGIRVQCLKKGQLTMDIDFLWGGDLSIILVVDAFVASLPIQLKDLQVFTVIRVIFQLSEEIPCISAVVVALLAEPKPRIDYTLKAVGGSLTAIPGLSDMIDDTVTSIITDMLEWPHRIVVPLGGVDVDISELELKPQGKLTVTIVRATSLKNQELVGKSDPYVVLYVRPVFKVKTKVVDDNLNPVWNETFELLAEDKETQSINFEVYDEDNLQQDKKMGVAKLSLQELKPEATKEMELKLLSSLDTLSIKDKKDRGSLTVKVLYHSFTKEEQLVALEEEKRALEARKKLKDEGVIGSTKAVIGRAASLVGSGVGMVDTGIVAGADLVQTGVGAGVGLVGSGLGAGAGIVGSGLGAGAGIVGSGLGAGADLVQTGVGAGVGMVGSGVGAGVGMVGSGLGAGVGLVGSGLGAVSRAGKFMGKSVTNQFSSSKKTSNPEKGARGNVSQRN
ncbi:calcium-dependent lipid-binding protein-like [Zingiber officinale]|uniref:calcium-dependent lipid-binding protein-like n=1 Tax=Zingiber officinale TaxID=94328 RepID=UPI001C4D98AA|nr:calcium-dependent lipid-binding protein-like [Zingiber officinale]